MVRLPSFEKCVGAIAATIVEQEAPLAPANANAKTVLFLLETHARMPDHLRLGLHILVLAFDAWPYVMCAKPFHRLDFDRRAGQLDRWRLSRVSAKRSLVSFYRALVIFGLYSELYKDDLTVDAHVAQR